MSRTTLVAALAAFPSRVADAARAADVDGRAASRAPDEWSPAVVVRHLIAVETDVHQARLADLATTEDPRWSWIEPPPWTGEPAFDLEALLGRLASLRAATLATVAALDEAGWARTGTHERLGVWDVAGLLRNAVDHDEEHLGGLTR